MPSMSNPVTKPLDSGKETGIGAADLPPAAIYVPGPEILVNTSPSGNQDFPTVTALSGGGYVVVWQNSSGTSGDSCAGQIFDRAGNRVGNELEFDTHSATEQDSINVAGLANGSFVVTWEQTDGDGSYAGIRGQIYTANGVKSGPELQINLRTTLDQLNPVVVALGNGFVVAWEDDGGDGNSFGIAARIFDADGVATSGDIHVNAQVRDSQGAPHIAALKDGGFVVAWEDHRGTRGWFDTGHTKARQFDSSGHAVGGELSVETGVTHHNAWSQDPSVVGLAGGGFIVAWQGLDAENDGIAYARVYNASSQAIASPFEISPRVTAIRQWVPVITALDDGGFVATYVNQGGSIWGQRYDADARAVGALFAVNGSDASVFHDITTLADGSFVISYAVGGGLDGDIYQRLYRNMNSNHAPVLTDAPTTLEPVANHSHGLIHATDLLAGYSDPDGDRLHVDGLIADHGTLTYNGDGTWSYAQQPGYLGTVTLNYTVSDVYGGAMASTATFERVDADWAEVLGHAGNDALDGRRGEFHMYGEMGNDTYVVDGAGDVVVEAADGGIDAVWTSVSCGLRANVENLGQRGETGDIVLTGNDLGNRIISLSGNDRLDGGQGRDDLRGGAGNDTYVVDNSLDRVTELNDQGQDTILASVTYGLGAAVHVETLILIGRLDLAGTGNELNNNLVGNDGDNRLRGMAGNDRLDGGAGSDLMWGGAGDDTYLIDNAHDAIAESSAGADSGGRDTVITQVSWRLGSFLENLSLTGDDDINGIGNGLDNIIVGNSGRNIVSGGGGNDDLTGGGGADQFVFGPASGGDTIRDFSAAQHDRINVHGLSGGVAYSGITLRQDGADTIVDLGSGNFITVVAALVADVASHMIW